MGLHLVWQHSSAESLRHERRRCAAISLIPHLCIVLSQFNRFIFFLLMKTFQRCFCLRCSNAEAANKIAQKGLRLGLWGAAFWYCKLRMQEEIEKDLMDSYIYTIPDKGLWEIHVLVHKNESFSNCLGLVRNFLNSHVSSKLPFLMLLKCLAMTALRKMGFQSGICGF